MILILASIAVLDFAWLVSDTQVHTSGVGGQLHLQTIVAFLVSGLINWMRNSNVSVLKWINPGTPQVAKILSGAAAFLVACGIAVSHSGTFSGGAGMTIVISGVSFTGLVNGLSTFISQWLTQHVAYEAVWRSNSSAPKA